MDHAVINPNWASCLHPQLKVRPIRVLHIRYTDGLCGPGKTILENVRAVTNGSVRYYVASFIEPHQKNNAFLERIRPYCPVLEIPTSSRLDIHLIRTLRSFIRQNNIDIIHTHEYKSDIFGLLAAKMEGIPIVTTVHGWFINNFRDRVYKGVDRFLLRFFDAVIAVSQKMYGEILNDGVAKQKLWLIPNAVVLENYSPQRGHPTLRDELNLAPDTFLIGNIGRLSPEKGQKDFIEAASQIAARYPKAYFMMVGDGPDRTFLYEYTKKFKLTHRVFFTGHRTDMANVYKSLDLVVLSSRTEGLPNIVLEAMAAMKPVIATDVGGTSELVIHNKTGLLVPSHSLHALTQAMEYALSHPDTMQEMSSAALDYIRKEFAFQKNVDRTVELYRALIQTVEARFEP